jgi:hypothetical protein
MNAKLLAFVRYIIAWRAWKLNILEHLAFYCAVYLHEQILVFLILIGSIFKRKHPQTIKEHPMSDNPDVKSFIMKAKLQKTNGYRDRPFHVELSWLSKYTDLNYDLFKRWIDCTYPDGGYTKVLIVVANHAPDVEELNGKLTKRELVVNLDTSTWRLVDETEEIDISFGAFPLFTKQND